MSMPRLSYMCKLFSFHFRSHQVSRASRDTCRHTQIHRHTHTPSDLCSLISVLFFPRLLLRSPSAPGVLIYDCKDMILRDTYCIIHKQVESVHTNTHTHPHAGAVEVPLWLISRLNTISESPRVTNTSCVLKWPSRSPALHFAALLPHLPASHDFYQ